MSIYVLIHGSWHDGTVWEPVAQLLRDAGHEVHTPTVAGHGKNVPKNVNHAQCTASIVDYIEQHDLNQIVLLGHSYGGTIISKVAEVVPERIRRLVFWNAFVLNDGECLLDNASPHMGQVLAGIAAASGDNTVVLPFTIWREKFLNDVDLECAQQAYTLLSPEPYLPFTEKLDMKKFYQLDIPKSYLNCTEDTALPTDYGWHPRMSSRLGFFRLVQMQGSHEVIFSNPSGLATKIIEAGRD
jgi:pimeloyl-ACP methyl ester carboxylesterase